MKRILSLLFFLVLAISFVACKGNESTSVLADNKVVQEKSIPSNKRVGTVTNRSSENDSVKVFPNQYDRRVLNDSASEESTTNDEIVKKALESKPTAKVVTKPLPKKKKEEAKPEQAKESRPVKKPIPNPVKSAPVRYFPKIQFDEMSHDFGEIVEGDIIKHNFTFTNTGNANLSVEKATASCGCTKPSFPFIDIAPGETGYIGVTYHSVSKNGEQKPEITVFSNAFPNQMKLYLNGTVKPKPQEEEKEADENEAMPQDTTKH